MDNQPFMTDLFLSLKIIFHPKQAGEYNPVTKKLSIVLAFNRNNSPSIITLVNCKTTSSHSPLSHLNELLYYSAVKNSRNFYRKKAFTEKNKDCEGQASLTVRYN